MREYPILNRRVFRIDIILAAIVLGIEFAISMMVGFIPHKYRQDLDCAVSIALGIIFPIAYLSLEFRTSRAIDANMILVAGVALFLPLFGGFAGMGLKSRIDERRRKVKTSKFKAEERETQDQEVRKEAPKSAEESIEQFRERNKDLYDQIRRELFNQELDDLVRWQDIVGKLHSAPETLTPAERAEIQQFAKDSEPYVGINTIAAIGGLESWTGEKPQPITQDEIDAMPDSVTVIYACPNCREVNKFGYEKMSTPILRAPDSMNIVGGRLFTTTSHTCSKCNYDLTMTLLQCDKCKIGWQPFFYAVHTPPQSSLLLSGTCYMCWDKVRDSSNMQN